MTSPAALSSSQSSSRNANPMALIISLCVLVLLAWSGAALAAAGIVAVAAQGPEFDKLKSDRFEVSISGDGGRSWANSFTYKTIYNIAKNDPIYESVRAKDTVSFTDFSSDFASEASVTVKVKCLTGEIDAAVIRPLNYGIRWDKLDPSTIAFVMPRARKVSVEINERPSGWIQHKLFIFGNPLETGVPNPTATNVKVFHPSAAAGLAKRTDFEGIWSDPAIDTAYFEKGLHYIPEDSLIPSGMTVYLAPGAYVFGSFKSIDPTWQSPYSSITIRGRGVLDSLYGRASQVWLHGSDMLVDGVTLLNKYKGPELPADGSGVSVSAIWLMGPGTARNVKIVDWMHAGGIFGLYGDFAVDDCFIFTNDDCIDVSFPRRSVITDCTTWNYYNGSAIDFSWNSAREGHSALVRGLNVIHWDSKYDDPGCKCGDPHDDRTGARMGVFFASHDSPVPLGNFTVEDVRIESMSKDSKRRFLALSVFDNAYSAQDGKGYHGREEFGGMDGIVFRNVTVDCPTVDNVLNGYDANAKITNVLFENLRIGGVVVTTLTQAKIKTNAYVEGVSFK